MKKTNKKAKFEYKISDVNLQRFYSFIEKSANAHEMHLLCFPSDPTLITISGGKRSLQFSIKPKKMVSVWQINDEIIKNIPFDLTKFELRNIGLKLNRRITFNLSSYGEEEMNIISAILKMNQK